MHATAPTDPSYGYTAHLRDVPFDEALETTGWTLAPSRFTHKVHSALTSFADARAVAGTRRKWRASNTTS